MLCLIGVVWVIRPRGLVLLDISPYTQISRYNTVTWYVNGCNTCLPMVCNTNYATIKSEVRFLEHNFDSGLFSYAELNSQDILIPLRDSS